MSELIGTLLELTSVVGQVQENAPLIAAAAAVPMLSLASWRFVSRKISRENYRAAPRPSQPIAYGSSVLEDVPGATTDPLSLYREFARKRHAQLIVLPPIDNRNGNGQREQAARAQRLNDFLMVYRRIPSDTPIDIFLSAHLNLDLTEIKCITSILKSHTAKISAIIPFQAFGPTCMLAFAADEIRMSKDATLVFDTKLTKAMLEAAAIKGRRNMSDKGLLQLHHRLQSVRETEALVRSLLSSKRVKGARLISKRIAGGEHDESNPIRASHLSKWGLPVQTDPFLEHYEFPSHPVLTIASAKTMEGANASKIAPTCAETCPIGDTRDAMSALEANRKSRVISVIHAPGMGSRSVDDKTIAEALKAIRKVAPGTSLDIVLHTPGGDALGAEQLALALKEHRGRITFFVPYHAFSAGTYLALTGHEIFLSKFACLGPIDAQLGLPSLLQTHEREFFSSTTDLETEKEVVAVGRYIADVKVSQTMEQAPAAAIASVLKHKRPKNIDDDILKHAIDARNCIKIDHKKAVALMSGNYSRWAANRIAHFLNDGSLSHSYPVQFEEAKKIGLHVSLGIPDEVYTIVDSFLFKPEGFCSVIHCSGEDEGAAA